VVDDDHHHLTLVSQLFEPIGFSLVRAPTAEMAQTLLQDLRPDMFILDIDMPG
jgi:CheY-like chemotaxis protein